MLRDRQAGTEWVIDTTDRTDGCMALDRRQAIVLHPDDSNSCSGTSGGVVVDLERGLRFEVADGRRPLRLLDDDRWLLATPSDQILSADLEDGDERLIADLPLGWWRYEIADDGLELPRPLADEAVVQVVLVPLDGSPAEVLARRAAETFTRLADGRVMSALEVDEQGLGDLVVVERGTLREHLIDRGVRTGAGRLAAEGALEPGVIAYEVVDGERSGIYLADLNPAPEG